MPAELKSNKAKIRSPEKVKEILDSYELDYVDINLHESEKECELEMSLLSNDPEAGPLAWALSSDWLPDKEEFPDDDAWFEAVDDLMREKGDDGFLALLRDLAPYLETPLMILAAGHECRWSSARVLRVQPGHQDVEELYIGLGD